MQKCSMTLAAVVAGVVGVNAGAWGNDKFSIIYIFNNPISQPNPLVALGDKLYGLTINSGYGSLFSLTKTGTLKWLHYTTNFAPMTLFAFDGDLFGATYYGGTGSCSIYLPGCGTLFGVSPLTGKGSVVQTFEGNAMGVSPGGNAPVALAALDGVLYGVASQGGANNAGAVFKTQHGVETVIYSFKGGTDGANPNSLIKIGVALYGTTAFGGDAACSSDECGTIFKLTPDGTETVLHAFTGGADGKGPSHVINDGGDLFAIVNDGANGSVVRLHGQKLTVIYSFKGGSDGLNPTSLARIGGMLYGTTGGDGGVSSYGTIFSLTKTGQETVLHRFSGADGMGPGALIASGNRLYGTTVADGDNHNNPSVFSYTP